MVSTGDTEISLHNLHDSSVCVGGGGEWLGGDILGKSFFGGGGGTKSQNRVNWDFLTKFSTTPACLCITDSLSHTTYVETNKLFAAYFCQNLKPMFSQVHLQNTVTINHLASI